MSCEYQHNCCECREDKKCHVMIINPSFVPTCEECSRRRYCDSKKNVVDRSTCFVFGFCFGICCRIQEKG